MILLKILNVRNNQRRRTMVHKYFRKKSAGTYAHTGTEINLEKQKLAEELHKPNVRKSKSHELYSVFKDKIWGADLAFREKLENLVFIMCCSCFYFRFYLCF